MKILVFLLTAGLALLLLAGAQVLPPCRAWLEATGQSDMLRLAGNCQSLRGTTGRYRYEMRLERQSGGGSSISRQAGEFTLAANQAVVVSSTGVNIDGRSTYLGYLRVYDGAGQLVAQDSVRHESENK